MKKIIINADDFGASSSVNKAIIELFKTGTINSTSIMANMNGFEEAVQLAHEHKITNKIGVHLVLTEGSPLSKEIESVKFLFHGKKPLKNPVRYSLFLLNGKIKALIYNELSMQIKKVKESGIEITHLDTHHHVHEYYGITRILLALKKEYNIPSIRILNNLNHSSFVYKRLYRSLLNLYIKKQKSNFSDLFGDQSDFLLMLKNQSSTIKRKSVEVMVHPDISPNGELIDRCGENDYNFDFVNPLRKLTYYEEDRISK